MAPIDWADIKDRPRGLHSGPQTVRITAVRVYTNGNGNRCIELMLENDDGGRLPIRRSIEPGYQGYIENFLLAFMGIGVADVIRGGGWQTLKGAEFMVDVEYEDGENPVLCPVSGGF